MIDMEQPPHTIRDIILSMPIEEQDYLIALWLGKPAVLNDMRRRPLPSRPIGTLTKDQEVLYYEERQKIKNLNWRNFKWLKWTKEVFINNGDRIEDIERLENIINQYLDNEEHPEPVNFKKQDAHWQD